MLRLLGCQIGNGITTPVPALLGIAEGADILKALGGIDDIELRARAVHQHHAQLTESVSAYDPASLQAVQQYGGGAAADPQQAVQHGAAMLNYIIGNQAAQIGFNEIFHLLGILFLVVILFVWVAKPPFAAKAGPAAGGH